MNPVTAVRFKYSMTVLYLSYLTVDASQIHLIKFLWQFSSSYKIVEKY